MRSMSLQRGRILNGKEYSSLNTKERERWRQRGGTVERGGELKRSKGINKAFNLLREDKCYKSCK